MLLQALRRAAVVCVLLCLTALLFAQTDNSSISGMVKDPTGAAVAGAKVTIRNEGTAFERVVNTNEQASLRSPTCHPVTTP